MKTPPLSDTVILDEIVARLQSSLDLEQLYLFGSRARGDGGDDSDYDFLAVVSESNLPGYARDRLALRALRGLRVPIDVVVLTRDEFNRKRDIACSLPATVEREGALLSAA